MLNYSSAVTCLSILTKETVPRQIVKLLDLKQLFEYLDKDIMTYKRKKSHIQTSNGNALLQKKNGVIFSI